MVSTEGSIIYYNPPKFNIIPNQYTAVGRSENPGGHIVLGGDNVPPLVEIGLTDLPKSGGTHAPPASPLATGLYKNNYFVFAYIVHFN